MDDLIKLAAGDEDELVRELLDELSPLFMQPYNTEPNSTFSSAAPTEMAPSYSSYGIHGLGYKSEAERISMLETSYLSKTNHDNISKYTLRINNSCGSVMADDGYKWRKYGQKSIKNSPNPRSYYRCTNPRCNAKKQVERSTEDPDTLIISYEGLHLHYTYPIFNLHKPDPPAKKHKGPITETKAQDYFTDLMGQQQGLLQDVVPLTIRNPASSHSSSSSTSYDRLSDPSSPNSFSTCQYLGLIL